MLAGEVLFGRQTLGRWRRLGQALRNVLPAATFRRLLDAEVGTWTEVEQVEWLETALVLAPASPRAAVTVYRETPASLRALSADIRLRLLTVLRLVAPVAEPGEIAALVPVLGALVLDVPRGTRRAAIDAVEKVGRSCPYAVPGLLRCLAQVLEQAPTERVREWVDKGLDLARENAAAAGAYFALESKTSRNVLHESPTSVSLEEAEGVLHRYVQMLSGSPATARAAGSFRLRPDLEECPGAGGIALPQTVDVLTTWEDNVRLYRVVAAFLAGRREAGTYADPDIAATLRASERPATLEECFLLADGYRVARRLARSYAGLAVDIAWAGKAVRARWRDAMPHPPVVLDVLLAHAIADDAEPAPVWLARLAAVALPCLAPLDSPSADVCDARSVAELLTMLITVPVAAVNVDPELPASAEFYLTADEGAPAIGGSAGSGDEHGSDFGVPEPLPPDLLADLQLQLGDLAEQVVSGGRPLSSEELKRLLDAGLLAQLAIDGDPPATQAGLYVTQLLGKLASGAKKRSRVRAVPSTLVRPQGARADGGPVFSYDEWDHTIGDYRPGWCQLREIELGEDAGLFFTKTLERHASLVPEIRRQFLRVRPESWRVVRGLEDGEDFDLNAVIDAVAERRARRSASTKLYTARSRLERDVATLFLLDMSASTDETTSVDQTTRRIIDIEKEALVIMAAALEEIGDAYAMYGFSGQGRHNVEAYPIKSFTERLAPVARNRIGGIEPRCSTRMGTALRHSIRKMRDVTAPNRYLILISDGFPQDLDYGKDRRSYTYGIRDTAAAFRELEAARIKPFCITVDVTGHDYLRDMCDPHRYMVIENVADLPRELPKIYQRLVRAA